MSLFFKENIYYPHLQFWGLQAKFKFEEFLAKGSCVVNFQFKDFIEKQGEAEFEINISSMTTESTISTKQKAELKQILLNRLEERKN